IGSKNVPGVCEAWFRKSKSPSRTQPQPKPSTLWPDLSHQPVFPTFFDFAKLSFQHLTKIIGKVTILLGKHLYGESFPAGMPPRVIVATFRVSNRAETNHPAEGTLHALTNLGDFTMRPLPIHHVGPVPDGQAYAPDHSLDGIRHRLDEAFERGPILV